MTVGRSSRTPFKHWLLNAHLGRIAGVLSVGKSPAIPCPFVCYDLCAGDGVSNDRHTSSPLIIRKHADWLEQKGVDVVVYLVEKKERTFHELRDNISKDGFSCDCNLIHGDSKDLVVAATHGNQAMFFHCDPNHVKDMPVTRELVESWTPYTTFLTTLGCNVGGLKMLPREQREEWFDYMEMLVGSMPSWHEAILVELVRDSSQWAYLLRVPRKWADQEVKTIRSAGIKQTEKGVEIAGYRGTPRKFREMVRRLFLTKSEIASEQTIS